MQNLMLISMPHELNVMRRFMRAAIVGLIFLILAAGASTQADAFQLKDTSGAPQRLADLKGKWVVVNFWATWCAPCVKEIPDLAAFAIAQGDKVQVLGIALDWDETGKPETDERKVKAFAKKIGHTYPLVLGTESSEKIFGKMKGLPTTIVYDPTGKIVYQKTGVVTAELLKRVIAGEKVS